MISNLSVCCLLAAILVNHSSSGVQQEFDNIVDAYAGKAQDYCLATEPFQAKCLRKEVIFMTSALYGRMEMGRCLEEEKDESLNWNDPRVLGCSVDVLPILDRRCSGKNQCEVRLTFDPDLQREKPCNAALKSYLKASFDCITVIEADRSCHVTVSSNPLHIMRSSSSTSALLNCGTKTQPWVLEAPAGQQINVSLLDFGQQRAAGKERGRTNHHHCSQQYGYIVDKAATANKNVSICGLRDERLSAVYQSTSNVIEVVIQNLFLEDENPDESRSVVLGFKAVGCTNMVPPEDTWLRRSNNEAVVGCYTSQQSWHLRCVHNVWIGVIGNCTRDRDVAAIAVQNSPTPYLENQVMIIVAIASVGLIVCVTIIVCGAVCLKRYNAITKGSYINEDSQTAKYGHAAQYTQQASLNGTAAGNEILLQA